MEYFTKPVLKHYADFTGRVRRKEYWMFVLFYVLIYVACAVVDVILGTFIIAGIFTLAMLVPSISIAARRLHDTSRSGWWQLVALIPLIGVIILLVFLVQDSHDENQYGPNPKQA